MDSESERFVLNWMMESLRELKRQGDALELINLKMNRVCDLLKDKGVDDGRPCY